MTQVDPVTAGLAELSAESDALDALVSAPGVDFATPTPAEGWTIGHQIGHLSWTDGIVVLACTDPEGFARHAADVAADFEATVNGAAVERAALPTPELLGRWRAGRVRLAQTLASLSTGARIPWIGTSMAAPTMISARMMETWAHGVDIGDALGRPPSATGRLRRVADLGIRTRDFAFRIHGRTPPAAPFRVELQALDGQVWTWGPPESEQKITGPALDFCLLITQRRPRESLAVTATGADAQTWTRIAQAYAGPPGPGR